MLVRLETEDKPDSELMKVNFIETDLMEIDVLKTHCSSGPMIVSFLGQVTSNDKMSCLPIYCSDFWILSSLKKKKYTFQVDFNSLDKIGLPCLCLEGNSKTYIGRSQERISPT